MSERRKPAQAPPRKVPTVAELPVTRAMLLGVRDELRSRIDAVDARFAQVDARFAQVDARFAQVDARFAQVDRRFEQVDARFAQMEARFEQVDRRFEQVDARFDQLEARIAELRAEFMAEVHRLGTLIEEQEARNRVVLEVVQGHNARFERIERRLDGSDEMLREILDAVRRRPST
ncbi:MAG: hypothetical protein HY909_12885 [Deltaproteobacteria bacterium]|nr:hypothetical protein [Deltaproteobacteria bacterium]